MVEPEHRSPLAVRFGARIKELREATGLTQMQFASEHGIDRTHLGFLEVGRQVPSLTTIARYADIFNMTMSELLDGIASHPR